MSKEIKNKIVPKFRFAEFRDNEEWESKALGSVIEIKGRIGYRGYTIEDIVNKGEGAISLSPSNFDGDGSLYFEKCTYISWFKYEESPEIMLEEGFTVLVKTGSSYGKTALVKKLPEKATINPQIVVLKPKKINAVFLFLIVSHPIIKKQIDATVVGGAIPTLSQESISKFEFFAPQENEQQKIASCLSSLDDLITAQSQKLEALKEHKKGLMQQLFPAEGETVPKLRFPEFRDKWQKDKLENVTDLQSGYAFQSDFFSNEGMKLVTPKNFTKDGYGSFIEENTKYTTEEVDSKYLCKEGDLLVLLTDLTPSCELLGKPLLLKREDGEVLLNQRIVRVISKGSIELRFLLYFFSTEKYHKRIKNTATGSTVRHSSNTIIANTEIYFPPKDEQQKIASYLSSIDELITAQTEKIEELKEHKKGLMQGLFPNINVS
jgi:restriction endonuclease S subunit